MQSGKLRFRVTLERPTQTQNEGGQVVDGFAEVATVKASIRALSGREFVAAQQVQADVSTEITIRWRDDVNEKWRIRHVIKHDSPISEDFYDIVALMPDPKTGRRELRILCTKRRAEGWRNADV